MGRPHGNRPHVDARSTNIQNFEIGLGQGSRFDLGGIECRRHVETAGGIGHAGGEKREGENQEPSHPV
jgi:hypothetical protein